MPTELPTTPEEAEALVRETLKTSVLSRERLLAIANETGEQAENVTASVEAPIAPPEVQPAPPSILNFAQCRDFLKDHGIDLEKHRDAEVKSALRWGLIAKESADQYGASFDNVQIPASDLEELVKQLGKEPDTKPIIIFGVDNMTPEQGFKKLIADTGIYHEVWRSLSEYQRVDAKTGLPLQNQEPTGKAGILFTPDHLDLPTNCLGVPPNKQLEKMAQGQKYVGPIGWMKLFLQSVDRAIAVLCPKENLDNIKPDKYKALVKEIMDDICIGLDKYLPDVTTGTQFPDLRHKKDGAVPRLRYHSHGNNRGVFLIYYNPEYAYGYLGARPAKGTFLA